MQVMTRFGEPGKMDIAPFGTICKVTHCPEKVEVYVQLSHDESDPNWTLIEKFSCDVSDEMLQAEIKKILGTP